MTMMRVVSTPNTNSNINSDNYNTPIIHKKNNKFFSNFNNNTNNTNTSNTTNTTNTSHSNNSIDTASTANSTKRVLFHVSNTTRNAMVAFITEIALKNNNESNDDDDSDNDKRSKINGVARAIEESLLNDAISYDEYIDTDTVINR